MATGAVVICANCVWIQKVNVLSSSRSSTERKEVKQSVKWVVKVVILDEILYIEMDI